MQDMVRGVFVSFVLGLSSVFGFYFNIVDTFGKFHTQLKKTSVN